MPTLPRPERSYVIPSIVVNLLMKAHDALELDDACIAKGFVVEALLRLQRAEHEQNIALDLWSRTSPEQEEARRREMDAM